MKTSIFVIFACCLQISLYAQDKTEINQTLDQWHNAAANADEDTFFGLMTTNAIFIGTDADENWQLQDFKKYALPHFKKGKAWTFIPQERNVYVNKNKNTAWFDEVLNSEHMGLCRGSGTLIKQDEQWKIAHYVLSILIPNESVKDVLKLKQSHDKDFTEKKSK